MTNFVLTRVVPFVEIHRGSETTFLELEPTTVEIPAPKPSGGGGNRYHIPAGETLTVPEFTELMASRSGLSIDGVIMLDGMLSDS